MELPVHYCQKLVGYISRAHFCVLCYMYLDCLVLIPAATPVGGHGNALQYSCLKNPMHRGAWRATVHGVAKSQA